MAAEAQRAHFACDRIVAPLPSGAPRLPVHPSTLAATFRRFRRDDLEAIAAGAIDELDRRDPDADLEPDGDEFDGNGSEDDFMHHGESWKGEPGCPISDPGGDEFEMLPTKPIYGLDQSDGPTNEREAHRERYQRLTGAGA